MIRKPRRAPRALVGVHGGASVWRVGALLCTPTQPHPASLSLARKMWIMMSPVRVQR
jgi:hypothetical protein